METLETISGHPRGRFLIIGDAARIDGMLLDIEHQLGAKGWVRDTVAEGELEDLGEPEIRHYFFAGGPTAGFRLRIGLTRVSGDRLLGWSCSWLSAPPGAHFADLARAIKEVIQGVVMAAASDCGLKVRIPKFGNASRIPPRTLSSLTTFSDRAGGHWPLGAKDEALWRRFVIDACQDDCAIDVEDLANWFVTCGWPASVARELTERFVDDSSFLSEYELAIRD